MRESTKPVRFRATDFFLILLALFAVVGVARRAGAFSTDAADVPGEYRVVAVWQNVDARTAECVQTGEKLYTDAGEYFGEIAELSATPREETLWEGGSRFSGRYPEGTQTDVLLTVLLRGNERDGMLFRANGRAVLMGETYRLYSSRASLAVTVRSFSSAK